MPLSTEALDLIDEGCDLLPFNALQLKPVLDRLDRVLVVQRLLHQQQPVLGQLMDRQRQVAVLVFQVVGQVEDQCAHRAEGLVGLGHQGFVVDVGEHREELQ